MKEDITPQKIVASLKSHRISSWIVESRIYGMCSSVDDGGRQKSFNILKTSKWYSSEMMCGLPEKVFLWVKLFSLLIIKTSKW